MDHKKKDRYLPTYLIHSSYTLDAHDNWQIELHLDSDVKVTRIM